jgi:hypothetical protein
MNAQIPTFAVIGRVNKGKSSIVSTLAEDDSVMIANEAGTTRHCREYPLRIDEKTIVTLIDTPGFQEARRMLAWLKDHEVSASNRRDVVVEFVDRFSGSSEFVDECRLLQPILGGAGILYVVDGAKPFRRNYEAEMEILRWTGQPRMALINQIGDGDFSDQWKPALDQYFSVVRTFNAHRVGFQDRIMLLRAFRELHEPWRASLDKAIFHLEEEWDRRRNESVRVLTDMMVDELTMIKEISLKEGENISAKKAAIERDFHQSLRKIEHNARRSVEHLYQHNRLSTSEKEMDPPIFEQDLFARATWNILGLSPRQLIGLGAAAGATVGGMVDASLGGASFLTGTMLGATVGGASALYMSSKRFASVETIGRYLQGRKIMRIGPHQNQNFPWILLDRALLHYFNVRDYAHGRREPLKLEHDSERMGMVSHLSPGRRKTLAKIFRNLQKGPRETEDLRQELYRQISFIVERENGQRSS